MNLCQQKTAFVGLAGIDWGNGVNTSAGKFQDLPTYETCQYCYVSRDRIQPEKSKCLEVKEVRKKNCPLLRTTVILSVPRVGQTNHTNSCILWHQKQNNYRELLITLKCFIFIIIGCINIHLIRKVMTSM